MLSPKTVTGILGTPVPPSAVATINVTGLFNLPGGRIHVETDGPSGADSFDQDVPINFNVPPLNATLGAEHVAGQINTNMSPVVTATFAGPVVTVDAPGKDFLNVTYFGS